jgi:DNA-directed RNA polymerase subunit M/transcription elongation factor TFIIS
MRTPDPRRSHATDVVCALCGASDVIEIRLNLDDDTEVDFHSCHRCEHRWWASNGEVLDLTSVLDRARRR